MTLFSLKQEAPASIGGSTFTTEEFSLYGLGPVDLREAVLLGNENTLLTAEKTIEYFI